ncbi:hypothetical protein Tco_0531583, partial [Tanacetum coccineum]
MLVYAHAQIGTYITVSLRSRGREKCKVEEEVVRQFSTILDFVSLEEILTEMPGDDDATRAESSPSAMDSDNRPGNFEDPSPIVYPAAANGAVSNFKIQPNLIEILPIVRGHEEPYTHLREFFSIADTYQVNNTTKDGVRLRLFPFSLKDQAKACKTATIRNKIKSFRQIPGEQFHEAFSRLKELLRTCPHHDVPKWELVKVFYDGLDYHNQQFMMATSGGMFFSRPMEEEWEFFEKLSKGFKTQASVDRNNNHTSFANFVSNQHGTNSETSELSKKVDLLLRNLGKGVPNVSQVSHYACSMCGDPSHSINNCQSWGAPSNEEVNGVYGNRPRNDPFSESYNPGWRNHPNFCWKDDDNYNRPNNTQQQNHGYKPRPQQYQNHGQSSSNGQQSNVDQKFDLILSELDKSNKGSNLKFESLSKSVVNLERQMGQLAKEVHKQEVGKLPSYPTLNPKHKPDGPEHVNMDFVTDDEMVVEGKKADNVKSDSELGGVSRTTTPYPATLEKSAFARLAIKGPHSEDMWEIFKRVKINLPLIDAIKQIPAYAKFLKDSCTQKRKLKATLPKRIDQTEHVNTVLSSSLPPKFKDP